MTHTRPELGHRLRALARTKRAATPATPATVTGLAWLLWILIATPSALAQGGDATDPEVHERSLRHYLQGVYLEEQGSIAEAFREYRAAYLLEPSSPDLSCKLAELSLGLGYREQALDYAREGQNSGERTGRAAAIAGASLLALGRSREAVVELERAVSEDSTRADAWDDLGRAREELDHLEDARAAYRHALELEPENGGIVFHVAVTEARLGHIAIADSLLDRVRELHPYHPGLLVTRAWVRERQGRLQEASELYEHHLRVYPGDQAARRRLVNTYVALDEHAAALEHAQRLVREAPDDLDALRVLAALLVHENRGPEAEALVRDAHQRRRGDPETAAFAIAFYRRLGREDEAREAVATLTRESERDYRAWLVAAEAWASWTAKDGGKPDSASARSQADAAFERARRILPDSTEAMRAFARALSRAKRYEEADAMLERARRADPDDTGAWIDLATMREERGDVPGAEAAIRKVLAREPENPIALNFLGYLLADHNKSLNEAVGLIQRALERDPGNPFFIDSLGWAFFRLGRLEEARVELERAIALGAADPVVFEHLGDVYAGLSLATKAKSQYQKALELDPGNAALARKLEALP